MNDKSTFSEISTGDAGNIELSKSIPEIVKEIDSDEFKLSVNKTEHIEALVHSFKDNRLEKSGEIILSPPLADRGVKNTFPINSYINQLIEDTEIEFRVYPKEKLPTLLLTPTKAYYNLHFGHIDDTIELTGDKLQNALKSEFESLFIQSNELEIGVPEWESLVEDLAQDTTEEMATEFESLVEELSAEGLVDGVYTAIIAGARAEELLYDISRWGEDAGIGSKATFSRRKTNLEEEGIVGTESVPVEVGRPRERLLMQNEEADLKQWLLTD